MPPPKEESSVFSGLYRAEERNARPREARGGDITLFKKTK